MTALPSVRIETGDCLDVLRTLDAESVHCCVTSPPYFGLRDYQTGTWEGGDPACDHSTPRSRGDDIKAGDKQGTSAGSRPNTQRVCRCGARRVDLQIGLEPTPEAYVARLVAVFREVRRVLRADGTLWLNLGDSFNAYNGNRGPSQSLSSANNEAAPRIPNGSGLTAKALKNKDLIGIPWSVAKALRDPYYTGTIKDERDRVWLAAMLDAEGCMFIHKRKAGQHNGQGYHRQNDNYGPGVEIANTSQAIIERIHAIVGKGSICSQGPDQTGGRRKQTIYRWNLRTIESREFVRELYPHLVGKRQQARLLCGCPSSGEQAEQVHASLIALHRGNAATIDFPAPTSCFEPGFYLRSDIIWNKLNPMPESVTDRPTKSHEYLFLLSKSARYYYDAAAIAEPASDALYQQVDEGYNGAGTKEYEANGVQNPSSVKARIIANARKRADRFGGNKHDGETTQHSDGSIYTGKLTRNKRTVWTVPTAPYVEAHFATFPPALIVPCVRAGCPAGGTVLDCFAGSGTTGLVALQNARNAILIELNPAYRPLIEARCAVTPAML